GVLGERPPGGGLGDAAAVGLDGAHRVVDVAICVVVWDGPRRRSVEEANGHGGVEDVVADVAVAVVALADPPEGGGEERHGAAAVGHAYVDEAEPTVVDVRCSFGVRRGRVGGGQGELLLESAPEREDER